MSVTIWSNNNQNSVEVQSNFQENPQKYRCHIAIIKDGEESFSVIVMNLPGAGSCGSSEEEAIKNTREAVSELIAFYLEEEGQTIPWISPSEYTVPEGAKQMRIIVNA